MSKREGITGGESPPLPSPLQVIETLRAVARDAPRLPGVYLWKDDEGRIIYIGKAKSLRDRLGSYFATGKDIKTATLMRRATAIETIIAPSEYEALILENTLIKQHAPKYNINLKDGKSYPVIRVTNEDFPRIFRTRRIVEDGSLYFGPFPDLRKVDAMLDLIDKLFPLRKCWRLRERPGPCMYYHIGRCKAPCCGKIHFQVILPRFTMGETDKAGLSILIGGSWDEEW